MSATSDSNIVATIKEYFHTGHTDEAILLLMLKNHCGG